MWPSVFRLLFFCVIVTLFFSGSTDADLSVNKSVVSNVWAATTLDFSNKDTSNNQDTNSLFSVIGLMPSGFQVGSVRIKNEGKMKFSYWLSAKQSGGDNYLFGSLKIKIMKNWVVRYDGKLSDMNVKIDDTSEDKDDWVFVLTLDNGDEKLIRKETDFGIIVKTDDVDKKGGFYVEQQLKNKVVTGVWNKI